jgi:hypothetical protein
MDANYFIAKFEAIPETDWCVGALSKAEEKDGKPTGKTLHCALGHCALEEKPVLTSLLEPLGALSPTYINDNWHTGYRQLTPKQRILAALRDVKAGE